MVPILPALPRMPVWGWLILIALFLAAAFGIGLSGVDPARVMAGVGTVAVGVGLVGGAAMVFWALRGFWRLYRLNASGRDGEAEILRQWSRTGRVDRTRTRPLFDRSGQPVTEYFVSYRYDDDGVERVCDREKIFNRQRAELGKGQMAAIRYLPGAPGMSRLMAVPAHVAPVMRGLQLVAGLIVLGALSTLVPEIVRLFGR